MLFTRESTKAEIWHALVYELHRGALEVNHPFRYLNLGTSGSQYPEIRTVVLRQVDEALNCYSFTDFRSKKVREIQKNPMVSLHFYDPQNRVQVRIQAKAKIHHQDMVTQEFWTQIHGDAQKAYNSTLAPGKTMDGPEAGWEWTEQMDDRFLAVLKFFPHTIELLQLDGLNHLRMAFSKKEDNWEGEWLVP